MDKTEKYNIASIDIHGHGCDVTEMRKIVNRSIVWCNIGTIHNSFS